MTISKKALRLIGDDDHLRCRNRLALVLNRSQYTIQKYINENSDELTKAAALAIISEETGLTQEEILTESPVTK